MLNILMRGGATAAAAVTAMVMLTPAATAEGAPSTRVSYAGLNLTNAAGKATFERRVKRAADRVCRVGKNRDISLDAIARRCAKEARAAAQPAMELAYRNAADKRLATQDVNVTVAP